MFSFKKFDDLKFLLYINELKLAYVHCIYRILQVYVNKFNNEIYYVAFSFRTIYVNVSKYLIYECLYFEILVFSLKINVRIISKINLLTYKKRILSL